MVFQPLAVVAVELQQLVVLGRQGLVGLAQCRLQFLDLMFVAALLLLALLLHRGPVMLQRLTGVGMFIFQRFRMGFVLSHAGGQVGDAFTELGDFRHPLRQGLLGRCVGRPLLVQCGFGSLQLIAKGDRFLPSLFKRLAVLLQMRGKALLCFGHNRLCLVVHAGREPTDQILQGVADGNFGAEALPFLFL